MLRMPNMIDPPRASTKGTTDAEQMSVYAGDLATAQAADTPKARNTRWANCLMNALAAHGVVRAVLCPGERNAALILALRASGRFNELMIANDARSAAFMAVGMLKVVNTPVVLVTTSGPATANVVPALNEAWEGGLPLIVLSCDGPTAALDGSSAGPSTSIGPWIPFTRYRVDLPEPSLALGAYAALYRTLDIALAACGAGPRAGGGPAGPVYIHMPLAGHDESEIDISAAARPSLLASAAGLVSSQMSGPGSIGLNVIEPGTDDSAMTASLPNAVVALCGALRQRGDLARVCRGLVIVGPDTGLSPTMLQRLFDALGWPVLADAGSGLRGTLRALNGCDALALPTYVPEAPPDIIVRLGRAVQSVEDYLLAHPCPTIEITPLAVPPKNLHSDWAQWTLRADTAPKSLVRLVALLAETLGPVPPEWIASWRAAEQAAAACRQRVLAAQPWGELRAMATLFDNPLFDFMHVANSMSVRHADVWLHGKAGGVLPVYTNWGAGGIDGTMSTFFGEVLAHRGERGRPVSAGLLVLGDQAFLHDLSALSQAQRIRTPTCVCVINNAGSAIYDSLALSQHPDYSQVIRNPTVFEASTVAAAFGLAHRMVRAEPALRAALIDARRYPGVTIVDVCVPALSGATGLQALSAALRDADALAMSERADAVQ